MLNMLEQLCDIPAPSGNEDPLRDYIISKIKDYADYKTDALGNLIVHKKGCAKSKHSLMICAHMDEVGFIVTAVTDEGLLKFSCIGGILPDVIVGRRVIFSGGITGIVGVKPVHLCDAKEKSTPVKLDDLYFDIGASSRGEAEKLVAAGTVAVFERHYSRFGDGYIRSSALDNRAGCAVMLALIQSNLNTDAAFVFSTQEEIGCRGAKTAAFQVDAETAIVLETTTAADIPGVTPSRQVCRLKQGPAISFMDHRTLYDKSLYHTVLATAKNEHIPCQPKSAIAGGNDAGSIHLSRGGVRTAAISVPCRYLHSASCVAHQDDITATFRLLQTLIPKIQTDGIM